MGVCRGVPFECLVQKVLSPGTGVTSVCEQLRCLKFFLMAVLCGVQYKH